MAQKKKFSKEIKKDKQVEKQTKYYEMFSALKQCDAWEKGYKKEIITAIRQAKELLATMKPWVGETDLHYIIRFTRFQEYIETAQKFITDPVKFLNKATEYLINIKKGGK